MLGSTKNNKVENDDFQDYSQLNSISFMESKNQVHNCRFELLNEICLPVLSALILKAGRFGAKIDQCGLQQILTNKRGSNYNFIINI